MQIDKQAVDEKMIDQADDINTRRSLCMQITAGGVVCLVLYYASRYNYLLFHTLAEMFSIIIAIAIFMFACNVRRYVKNDFLIFLGMTFFFVAAIDMVHALVYSGMNIFPGHGETNLSTQTWLAARYLQAFSLLVAPLFLSRRLPVAATISILSVLVLFILTSIFYWQVVPVTFVEGVGLTPFKIISEYLISLLLLIGAGLLHQKRALLDRHVYQLMISAILITVLSELALTHYTTPYEPASVIGHLFKILSFWLIYKAIIRTGLQKPFRTVFHELQEKKESLTAAKEQLEDRVRERTAELAATRDRLQQELVKKENLLEELRATFEQAAVGVAHVALDGNWLRVNRKLCDIVGYPAEELTGLAFQDITHPDDLESDVAYVQKVLSGELQTYSREKRYIRKDRSLVWINLTVSLVRDAVGAPLYFIVIVEDIDERKQAELELKQHREHLEELVLERTTALEESQRALMNIVEDLNLKSNELGQANARLRDLDRLKSMFIASMSHELRTPLNSIIGFTGLIIGNMAGAISDEQRDMLERVSRAGKHLLSLITDVIDIAKIESGKIVPYPEEFDLHALFDEAVGQVRPQAEEKGLAMEVHLPEHPVTIYSDRKRLLQCLLNYLSNAVKFSEKGTVHVEVKTATKGEGAEAEAPSLPEGWLEISVSDTGIGIREEDMKLLFGSFVRLETPLKTTPPGTGLGLYLTKKLTTEVLGGTVGAESQEGRGSRFWLRMPMVSRITK